MTMMKRLTTCAVALAAVAALSACDDNDSTAMIPITAPDPEPTGPQLTEVTQTLLTNTGAQETETEVADQRGSILNDDDEFVDSDGGAVVIDSTIAGNVVIMNDDGEAETLTPTCSGSAAGLSGGTIQCTATNDAGEDLTEPVDPMDIIDTATIGVLFEKNGIEINEGRGREGNENYRIYGAFMEYAAFSIQTGLILADLPGQEVTVPLALGDVASSRPGFSTASWEGVMVATTRTGDVAGNILQGDASLDFTGQDSTLDIDFDNIVDIDRGGADHSFTSFSFSAVPVAAQGTYGMRDDDGRYVSGAFYGPSHEESAGVFEASGLVGSFGALRTAQAAPAPTPTDPAPAPDPSPAPDPDPSPAPDPDPSPAPDPAPAPAPDPAPAPNPNPAPDPEPTGPRLTEVTEELLEETGATATETTVADQRERILNDDDEFVDGDENPVVFDADVDGGVISGDVVIMNAAGEEETLTPSCIGSAAGLSGGTIECSATNSDGVELTEPVDPTDIIDTATIGVLFEKNGIDINEGRGREGNENYRIYGAFMKYASFIIQTGLELEDLPGQEVTFPLALGDATEGDFTLSTASASWEGVMVATTRTGAVANNILQGDASLTYTGADNTLDIAFANIVDIDRGGANHSLTSLKFDDVRVAAEGTYAMRDDNGYVDGAFYGPSHEEAAGVFEYSNLVGSFGALQTEIEILFTDVTPTLLTAVGGEAATADIIDEGAGNALAGPETTATTVADILQDRLGGAMTFTPPDGYTVQGITLEADGTTTGPFTAETNADGIYTPAQTAEEGRNQVLVDEDRSAVLYRHTASGLVLIESRQRDSARRAFGSWLKNASFAVITGVEVDPRIDPNAAGPVSYAYAAGDATGDGNFDFGSPSAATTSASWEGVMVATARIGTAAGSILQGDALLTYVVDDNAVDIDFTNIVNIDREGADHSVTQVSFNDVSVTSQGTYAMSSINRSVSGAFYGPSHAEAAGVFRASGLVGSFGALLQEDEIETLFTEVTPTLLTALGGETPTTTVADILEDRLGGETAFASPDGYIVQLVTLTQSSGMTTPSLTATANGDQIYTPAQTAEEGRRQVLVDEDRSTVLYRHTASGLDLIESRQRDADRRAFGSWMQNASFAVITNVDVTDVQPNAQSLVSYAYAAGDPTGSNLTGYIGRATWEGVMLATARTGNVAGNILQGDASLTFGQDNGSAGYLLDIAFTNIRDIDRGGAPHGDGSDIEFPDVAVSENGRYAVAETGNNGQSLAGAFYGPSHEEAAGVFEHSNLVGSFGALLRDDETETLFTEVTPELLTAVGGEVADLLDEGAGDALAGPETTTTTIAHIRAARIDSAGNFIDDDLSPVEFDSIDGAAYYVENKGEDDENVITFTSTCTGESSSTTTIINCPLDSGGYTANAPYNPALLTDEDTSAVLYRHAASGLEMIESRQRDSARRAFGSWMEYASFAVITESTVVETTPETGPLTFAFAAGDATGARPTNNIVSATWEGVMVATTLTGDAAGNILQGDASLEYTGADNELDVMFDRIVNIDLDGAAHSDPSFGFEDVILQADGTYTQRTTNNDGVILERLDGSLYGPGHEEAAGFFEHSDSGLVGSFGAFQTEIETPFLEVTQALLDAVGGEETDTTVADIRGARINSEGDFIDDDGLDVTFNRVDEIVYSADGLAFQRTRCRSGGTSSSINTDIVCDLSTLRNNESVDIAVRFNPDFLADESGSMVLYRHSNSELDIIESAQVDSDRRTFGAWMEYAYFGVVTDTIIDDERLTLVVASGETTGNRPNSNIASATWDGVMVATTITGAVAGNILQGDALLEYDGSDNTLDIDFTEIVDIDRAGDDHSVPSVGFEDVGLSENGTYEVDEEDDNGISLSGALYGPGYENAAGTFEHSGMVGSFGADFAFESITAPNSGGE